MVIRNNKGRIDALDIRDDLVEAVREADARGDDGLTLKEAGRLTGMDYNTIRRAVSELVTMGCLAWGSRGDRNVVRIVPPDWEPPEQLELTRKQQAVLDHMISVMDDNCFARTSFRDIHKGALTSKGAIMAHIDALDRKGYIRIVERGRGTTKTLFEVYPHGNGPRGFSPMKPLTRSGNDNPFLNDAIKKARIRWGRASAFRVGCIVGEEGLPAANPYSDVRARAHFDDGVKTGAGWRQKRLEAMKEGVTA